MQVLHVLLTFDRSQSTISIDIYLAFYRDICDSNMSCLFGQIEIN